jgi:hypothetical protein
MQFRLRTLLIVLAVGPIVLWAGWLACNSLRPKAPVEKPIYYSHRFVLDVF